MYVDGFTRKGTCFIRNQRNVLRVTASGDCTLMIRVAPRIELVAKAANLSGHSAGE